MVRTSLPRLRPLEITQNPGILFMRSFPEGSKYTYIHVCDQRFGVSRDKKQGAHSLTITRLYQVEPLGVSVKI